ncbi:MAG: hypothetical protein ACOX0U_00695 [Oscillospiraceae bacterium]|jgi:hypothetical protein
MLDDTQRPIASGAIFKHLISLFGIRPMQGKQKIRFIDKASCIHYNKKIDQNFIAGSQHWGGIA